MTPKIHDPKSSAEKQEHAGEPVAEPTPPLEGRQPIPAGDDAIEKFLITTDTGGGD